MRFLKRDENRQSRRCSRIWKTTIFQWSSIQGGILQKRFPLESPNSSSHANALSNCTTQKIIFKRTKNCLKLRWNPYRTFHKYFLSYSSQICVSIFFFRFLEKKNCIDKLMPACWAVWNIFLRKSRDNLGK